MKTNEFVQHINNQALPVILDIGAPWCGQYRKMESYLKRLIKEYEGRVSVLQINADVEPGLMKALAVIGIPTLVGYAHGKRIFRKTGCQSKKTLGELFEAVLGNRPVPKGIHPLDRILRLGNGIFVGVVGWINGPNYVLLGIALLLAFSAVYDQCALCQAIAARLMNGMRFMLSGKAEQSYRTLIE